MYRVDSGVALIRNAKYVQPRPSCSLWSLVGGSLRCAVLCVAPPLTGCFVCGAMGTILRTMRMQ